MSFGMLPSFITGGQIIYWHLAELQVDRREENLPPTGYA